MSASRAHDPPPDVVDDLDDDVVILRWPDGADTRHDLAHAGVPRLLVVAVDEAPPLVWADDEDWMRDDASPAEVAARASRLTGARRRPTGPVVPVLDLDGVLRAGDGIVIVPPIEAAILAALLDRVGHVVRRTDLHRAGWPGAANDERAVDGRIRTLRRRLAGVALTIHTVRGVGYLLELDG